jgi:putative ATPase
VRGSDPDAALYWLARMLEGGEDPRFLARRITRMAVEDIGLADPAGADAICLDAWETYERLGSPEGELALAQAVLYLALAPKSNAAYVAYKARDASRRRTGSAAAAQAHPERAHRLMKDAGLRRGLRLRPRRRGRVLRAVLFPEGMERAQFYEPVERGFERDLKKRLDWFSGSQEAGRGLDGKRAPPRAAPTSPRLDRP